jgi:hypothetical protein
MLTFQTVTAFEEILEGKHDSISENSFYSKFAATTPLRS